MAYMAYIVVHIRLLRTGHRARRSRQDAGGTKWAKADPSPPFATVSFHPLTAGDATGFGMTIGVVGAGFGGVGHVRESLIMAEVGGGSAQARMPVPQKMSQMEAKAKRDFIAQKAQWGRFLASLEMTALERG